MENGPQKARKCYSMADGSPFWGVMSSRARGCSPFLHTVADHDEKPPARGDMSTGWGGVFLSDALERDSRPFQTAAYIVICVDD